METLKSLSELISLKGKRALITGAAMGIGRAMAYRFAEAGADLELIDINAEGLRIVKKELSRFTPLEVNESWQKHKENKPLTGFNSKINIHKVDLSKKEEINALWKKLKGKEPDILVNNAAIYPFKNFLEVDDAFFKKVMDTNLNSVFWMCHQMIRRRLKRGGVIINVGSIEAILPFAKDLVPYSMSKIGIIALTRSLAKEYAKDGFRINIIIPGWILTPGTKEVMRGLLKFKVSVLKLGLAYKLRLPIGRQGEPDEVARIALVLASDLSSYIQGALIPVDGGFLST